MLNACDGRLSAVRWFRTDWQRGGALTGYATYCDESDQEQPVVVKMPVGPGEQQWLRRISETSDVVPRVWAWGQALGGYDLAWVVMEQLHHGPLSAAWAGKEFELLVEAVVRFYAAAQAFPVDQPPKEKDWPQLLDKARQSVRRHNLSNGQRWSKALKKANRKLKAWQAAWDGRPTDQWCHGDLHLANAMTRVPCPGGPAVLLDFALTHPGHWVEDAIYLEHLYWAQRDKLHGYNITKQIARQRKQMGLAVSKDWPQLANAYRALLAMATPATLHSDGNPRHLQAALEMLENIIETT